MFTGIPKFSSTVRPSPRVDRTGEGEDEEVQPPKGIEPPRVDKNVTMRVVDPNILPKPKTARQRELHRGVSPFGQLKLAPEWIKSKPLNVTLPGPGHPLLQKPLKGPAFRPQKKRIRKIHGNRKLFKGVPDRPLTPQNMSWVNKMIGSNG